MRILFVLSRVPYPLEKGDKLRAFHLIRVLAEHHEVHLFCLAEERVNSEAKERLKQYCKEVHFHRVPWYSKWFGLFRALFTKRPFQVEYFYSKSAHRKLEQVIENHLPQHIFCQLVRTVEYVKPYKLIPKTLDYMDAFSAGMQRMAEHASFPLSFMMKMEYRRLKAYEIEAGKYFDNHTIISEQDRDCIKIPQSIHVIPNGIGEQFLLAQPSQKTRDILFTGNMSYRPNVESARFLINEIMPIVWKRFPDVKVCLAGANPSPAVLQLQGKNVEITGWVEDIVAIYQSARVFIAPMLINSGLQNKLLEAMACKLPAVTTQLANNALKATDDQAILIGNDAESLAAQLCRLLSDNALCESIAKEGYLHVLNQYSWQREADRLLALFQGKASDLS